MDIIQYKCPNCGAEIKFDPASGKYTCEYCKSSFLQDVLDKQTNEKTEQAGGSAGPASSEDKTADQTADGRLYICPSCGAAIITDATTVATFCFYCHNPVVLSGKIDGSYRPDYVVPFRIDRSKAEEIFDEWIRKKKYIPRYFYSRDQIDKLSGVYFPYLMYTCSIGSSLSADGKKTEVYTRGDVEYTDVGVYHVERSGSMEVKHVLRSALKKANRILSDSVLPFDTKELKPFNMSYLSGFIAEKRDIEKSDYAEAMRTEMTEYAVERLKDSLAGYTDIDVSADNVRLGDEKWEYALFPVWTLTYNDRGKIYYFSINGQTGKTVGELPVDKNKLIRTFLAVAVPFAAVLLLFFYFVI